jgi:hypothetical protein
VFHPEDDGENSHHIASSPRPNSRVTSRQIGKDARSTALGGKDAFDAALLKFRLLTRVGLFGANPQDTVARGWLLLTKYAFRQKFGPSHA